MSTPTVTIIHTDWGITIRVTIGIDLTGNTDLQLIFLKPDSTTVTKNKAGDNVTYFGALGDGVLEWNTTDAFFDDAPGSWRVHPRVVNATGEHTGHPAADFTIEELFQT